MNNFWRVLIAGYGAKKIGGGCLSTIIVFIIIYYALGTCNSRSVKPRHTDIHLQTHSITTSYFISKTNKETVATLH